MLKVYLCYFKPSHVGVAVEPQKIVSNKEQAEKWVKEWDDSEVFLNRAGYKEMEVTV